MSETRLAASQGATLRAFAGVLESVGVLAPIRGSSRAVKWNRL